MLSDILGAFRPQLLILACIYVLVLAVIFLDLWAGVRKAKARGEYRSSFGYRKTVDKIGKYFNMLFIVTVIDAVQMLAIWQLNEQTEYHIPLIPIMTFIGGLFAGFIELKSVYEKSEDKAKAKINEVVKLTGQVLKDKDTQSIVAALVDYMNVEGKKNKRKKTKGGSDEAES